MNDRTPVHRRLEIIWYRIPLIWALICMLLVATVGIGWLVVDRHAQALATVQLESQNAERALETARALLSEQQRAAAAMEATARTQRQLEMEEARRVAGEQEAEARLRAWRDEAVARERALRAEAEQRQRAEASARRLAAQASALERQRDSVVAEVARVRAQQLQRAEDSIAAQASALRRPSDLVVVEVARANAQELASATTHAWAVAEGLMGSGGPDAYVRASSALQTALTRIRAHGLAHGVDDATWELREETVSRILRVAAACRAENRVSLARGVAGVPCPPG